MLSALLASNWPGACTTEPPPPPELLPPTANRATYDDMWADVRAPRAPGDGGGTLSWSEAPPQPAVAGTEADLALRFDAGPHGIETGGVITFLPSPFWGWSSPQTQREGALGYTTFEAPTGVVLSTRDVAGMVLATVSGRALTAGEGVEIRYHGVIDRFAERHAAVWVAVDGDGDGVRSTLPPLTFPVQAQPAHRLVATWPSTARPADSVVVRIAALDLFGNAAPTDVPVRLDLPPALGPARPVKLENGVAAVTLPIANPGIYVVEAHAEGLVPGVSNPLVVRTDVVPILWADLQVHSGLSDGTGDPADLYRYAQQVAGLDVVAVTDHDHWGMRYLDADPELQRSIARATDAAYVPGVFVTVHGYEWTSWAHGHRHVLWFDQVRPWLSSMDPAYDTPAELHAALRGQSALVVRHHPAGGPIAVDWSFPVDPELEPVVEVASVHGQSESPDLPGAIYAAVPDAFVNRILAHGARFGLIGSTDGHDGHPGLSHLAGPHGGLAALEGAEPTRGSVLATLRARRVYATNGPRILLRVSRGNTPMGGVFRAANDEPAPLVVRAVGTAPIAHVEVVSTSAGVVASRGGDGSPLLFATFDIDPPPGTGLYVRVLQVDGGIAWSSPIFSE